MCLLKVKSKKPTSHTYMGHDIQEVTFLGTINQKPPRMKSSSMFLICVSYADVSVGYLAAKIYRHFPVALFFLCSFIDKNIYTKLMHILSQNKWNLYAFCY